MCAKGYHGSNCQFHTCDGYCEHGRCLVDEDNQPFCFCDLGYFGERCQHSLCQMFCVNGECQLNHGDFVCSCFEGWFGPMCQQQSEDIKNAKTISDICQLYCLNDGDCISSDNDFDLPTCR